MPSLPRITGNLLKEYQAFSYQLDSYGNVVRKARRSQQQYLKDELLLNYDAENQLIRCVRTRYQTRHTSEFRYDAMGRRIAKHIIEEKWRGGDESSGWCPDSKSEYTAVFIWDGDRMVMELREKNAAAYLYEADGFVPLARIEMDIDSFLIENQLSSTVYSNYATKAHATFHANEQFEQKEMGNIVHYNCDQVGLPNELVNEQAEIVWRMQFKSWGRQVQKPNSEIDQYIRFQGQYHDVESGLHYNRYRYFDPDVGRFLSPDPIGLLGGINGFSYGNNPTGWIDPLGLSASCSNNRKSGRFSTADAAAKFALQYYNPISIRDNREYGGIVYKGINGKYDFTKAIRGDLDGVSPWEGKRIPKGCGEVGYWHTHGDYADGNGNRTDKWKDVFGSDSFSKDDIQVAHAGAVGVLEYRAYVGTPSGVFRGYDAVIKRGYIL